MQTHFPCNKLMSVPQTFLHLPFTSGGCQGTWAIMQISKNPGENSILDVQLCREHLGLHPCDRRGKVSLLRKTYPAVDFSLVCMQLLYHPCKKSIFFTTNIYCLSARTG